MLGVAFSAAHGLLFITNTGRGTVSAIDMVREEIVGEYAVGPAPEGIAVLPQSA
jgi:DNA-binding beta-propeller fold protein YncE